jgi:hypothetical protein
MNILVMSASVIGFTTKAALTSLWLAEAAGSTAGGQG